eukprot:scaffold27779_cov36-Phaeocystis_antarctica.AAC.1
MYEATWLGAGVRVRVRVRVVAVVRAGIRDRVGLIEDVRGHLLRLGHVLDDEVGLRHGGGRDGLLVRVPGGHGVLDAWRLVRGRGSAYLPWMTEVMSARSCLSTVVHTLVRVRVRVRCRGRAR